MNENEPWPRSGALRPAFCGGVTPPGISGPRSTKCRPFSGISCTVRLGHHLADRHRRGLDERRRAGDRDVLGERADAQLQVERDGLRRAELELALLILESVDVRRDLVMPGRERRRDVLRRPRR